MRIRVPMWAAVAVLAVNALACHGQTKLGPPPPPAPGRETWSAAPSLTPEEIGHIKNLLFADIPLEEFIRSPKAKNPDQDSETVRVLEQAVEEMRQGRPAEAKGKLKQVLSLPKLETRLLLLTWNTLRGLGERPRRTRPARCRASSWSYTTRRAWARWPPTPTAASAG